MSFKFNYKGVEYDSTDPKFKELMASDELKSRLENGFASLSKKEKESFSSAVMGTMMVMCDELIDVIRIEKGLYTTPTTSVKEWTKDGNLLTSFMDDEDDMTVGMCINSFCPNACRKYINSQLGYEVKTTEYTYPDGHKGLAVVLD